MPDNTNQSFAPMVANFNYYVCLPIYTIGATLSGCILITTIRARTHTLQLRLDWIVLALTFVFFIWALVSSIRGYAELSRAFFSVNGSTVFTSLCIVLIFGINMALCVERYHMVARSSREESTNGLIGIGFTFFLFSIMILFAFFTLPATNEVEAELINFFSVMQPFVLIPFWLILILMTCAIYCATYLKSIQVLKESLGSKRPELIPALSRKIFWSSFVMGMSVLITYIPMFTVMLVDSGRDLDQDYGAAIRMMIANFFLAIDVIATPILVLYFRPKMFLALKRLGFLDEE
ncbi:hypothetical protein BDR26DRAFT_868856 [Obelidium mucronatum]|nr:hypothetical protein BDR26DRAFT_868856 [Obelidium mucronatum]